MNDPDPDYWTPNGIPDADRAEHTYDPGTHQLGYDTHVHLSKEELAREEKFQARRRRELQAKLGRTGPGF